MLFIVTSDLLLHTYIVSYNSVQNGLVYFICLLYMHTCMQCDVHQNETLIN